MADEAAHQMDPQSRTRTRLTLRAVIIGLLLCAFIGLAAPYWTFYLNAGGMFADYDASGPVFLLAGLIVLFNVILARLHGKLGLTGAELRTITAMTLTAGAIVTAGLIAYVVPAMSAPYYFVSEATQIETHVHPHLRSWLFALDPNGGTVAIEKFWAGIPAGEPIPWRPWLTPLLSWGIFALSLFGAMIAFMMIMRKQWIDYEHLSFPIAQIPLELCRTAEGGHGARSITRDKVFWIGLGYAILIGLSRGLHTYIEAFPTFEVRHNITGLGPMPLKINLSLVIMGLVFLVPNRVAFSLWALNLVTWTLRSFVREYGFGLNEWMLYGVVGNPEVQHLSMGACLVFTGASLWAARTHLGRAVQCALGRRPGYDRGEPVPYAVAFAVMAVGTVVALIWFRLIGLRFHYGVALLVVTFAVYYGMSRVIAQCGLPRINSPAVPSVWLASALGPGNLGAEQSTALGCHLSWHADLRNSPMSGSAHGLYLTGRRFRGLFWAMMAALVVTYMVGALCTIGLGYRHGASTLHDWWINLSARLNWQWTANVASSWAAPSHAGLMWTGAGAAVMAVLVVAHRMLFWWPLHPVGFLTSGAFLVTSFWFSIFLSWLAKSFVVYLGGARLYRVGRRLCIGLVLGSFVSKGLWAIIHTLAQVHWEEIL